MIKMERKCENCALRLELKVHNLIKEKEELEKLLKDKNVEYVCLAFISEGIGIIGDFEGIGCEAFVPKQDENF
jgi:hypothetical protein